MNNRTIKAFPDIDIRHIFAKRRCGDPVFDSAGFQMYASGRSAIYHAVKGLGLSSKRVFLLPAFHCGVEVEAILRAGCQVAFYRVNRDLSLDLHDLARRCNSQTAGILIIHYFGIPQDLSGVKILCAENGSVLIEDSAHALYSRNSDGQLLGSIGDFGIFSLQKTVALPNGGGLLTNASDRKKGEKGNNYYDHTLAKVLIRSSLEFEEQRGGIVGNCASVLLSLYRRMAGRHNYEVALQNGEPADMRWYYEVPRFGYENDISALSIPFVGKEPIEQVVSRRRNNYIILETLLKKAGMSDLLLIRLAEECCPLCLPIIIENRDEVVTKMQIKGVEPFVFGRFAHPLLEQNAFPDAGFLADSIVGLPVQQQLDDKDMQTVFDVLCTSYS